MSCAGCVCVVMVTLIVGIVRTEMDTFNFIHRVMNNRL